MDWKEYGRKFTTNSFRCFLMRMSSESEEDGAVRSDEGNSTFLWRRAGPRFSDRLLRWSPESDRRNLECHGRDGVILLS